MNISKPDRRAKLLERRAQIEAQLKDLDARQKQADRKRDTRRKIIAGALALEHAETNEAFAAELIRLLNRSVRKPEERALFHFLDGHRDEAASGLRPDTAGSFAKVANAGPQAPRATEAA